MIPVQKGFTLIELMIVIVIIGILSAIAIPIYQNHIAKSQTTEAFSLAHGLKTSIATNLQTGTCFSNGGATAADTDTINGKYGTAIVELDAAAGSGCGIQYTFNSEGVSKKIPSKAVIHMAVSEHGLLTPSTTSLSTDKVLAFTPNSFSQ